MRTPPSRAYNTRHTHHVSFEQHELNITFQDIDGIVSPCFFLTVKDRGFVKKETTILRSIELRCYHGVDYKEKKLFLLVTKDITFKLFCLLLLVSIIETRTIRIKKDSFYMNAKCKVE